MNSQLVSDKPKVSPKTYYLITEAFFLFFLFLFVIQKNDTLAMLTSITASGLCLIIAMVELKKQQMRFIMVLLSIIAFVAIYFIYKDIFSPYNNTAYCLIACCMFGVIAAFRKRYISSVILFIGVVYSIVKTQAIVILMQYQPEYRTRFAISWWWLFEFVIFIIAGYIIQVIVDKFIEHSKISKLKI